MRAFQLQRTRRTYALLQGPEDDTPFLNIWDFPTKAQAQSSATQAIQSAAPYAPLHRDARCSSSQAPRACLARTPGV